MPKATSQAWTEGALVYWSGTNFTTTSSSNRLVGHAVAAADSADTTGTVAVFWETPDKHFILGAGAGNTPTEVLVAVLQRMGVSTGIDLDGVMDVAEDLIVPLMKQPVRIDRDALTLGYAGVYSSFLLFAKRAAARYGLRSRDLLVEMGFCDGGGCDVQANREIVDGLMMVEINLQVDYDQLTGIIPSSGPLSFQAPQYLMARAVMPVVGP
jgi:hypothetical protein